MLTNFNYPASVSDEGYLLDPDDHRVKSFPVAEHIPFGRVIGTVSLDGSMGQLPSPNKFVFSADLIASNVIGGNVTILSYDSLGVLTSVPMAISPVTFATSLANTMVGIKAAIETLDPKLTANIDTTDVNNRTIYVTHSDNLVVILSGFGVTAGTSQANVAYTFFGKLIGVTVIANRQPDSNGVRQYRARDEAGVLTEGRVVVKPIDYTDINSTVFVQFIDQPGVATRGTIRNSSSSGNAISFATRTTLNSQATALNANILQINLP